MMNFDNSWQALFRPSQSNHFFDLTNTRRIRIDSPYFCPINAWWLAEISRLIYKHNGTTKARTYFLQNVNFTEVSFFDRGGTQYSIIFSRDCNNKKFAILVFRGTNELIDYISDIKTGMVKWRKGGSVHRGFCDSFFNSWPLVSKELERIKVPIIFTGHSQGGALATLAASMRAPNVLYTFGSPKVGDKKFKDTLEKVKIYRVVNNSDIITKLSISIPNCKYVHVGKLQCLEENLNNNIMKLSKYKHLRWYDPPRILSEHAPVNYVARLERLLL